ncbi:DNA topoisomerase IB [Candidatus Berkelbacteria bacterium]|nr:DNA topoisomerase IB [Candidatus Berkelbacteria bacterium]
MTVRTIRQLYNDPALCARRLRLRYIQEFTRGYRQEKAGRGLAFYSANGRKVTDPAKVEWLKALRVPPAWTEVWINPSDRGHILAVGIDEAGRKQYRYHPRWTSFRTLLNTYRLIPFGYGLSAIRAKTRVIGPDAEINEDTTLLAAIRLLDETWIRIGMPTEETEAVGLVTLEEEHLTIGRDKATLEFTGKSGQEHEITVQDKPLTKFLAELIETGDEDVFSFTDDDKQVHNISAEALNTALRELAGHEDVSAKDFRTWGGTLTAFEFLAKHPADSVKDRDAVIRDAVEAASEALGNTPAVARKSYIHPHLLESYKEGKLVDSVSRMRIRKPLPHLEKNEQRLLRYLENLLAEQAVLT